MTSKHSIGLWGGQIGHTGTYRGGGGDDEEAQKRHFDATCLRGSYQYAKYGLTPPPTLNKREARANQGGGTPASASTSRSRYHASSFASASALRAPRERMEVDAVQVEIRVEVLMREETLVFMRVLDILEMFSSMLMAEISEF
jgi:hypothetical protein